MCSVTSHSIWLDGPSESAEAIGARGYAYGPFTQPGEVAVEPHVIVMYVKGRTAIERSIQGHVERAQVEPGDLSFQSTATVARWRWSNPIDVLHVYITPMHLRSMAQRALGGEFGAVKLPNRLRVTDHTLARLGFELIDELARPLAPGHEIAARAIGDRLLVQLLRAHAELEPHATTGTFDADTTAKLEAFIAEHLEDGLELPELARITGHGVHHFCRLFRRTYAQTPHDFVRARRIAAAKAMLTETPRTISEIAHACGFADQSHLTRCFKTHVGDTPARFRERMR